MKRRLIASVLVWRDGEKLIVRGQIGPFGQKKIWHPVQLHEIPPNLDYGDPGTWIPIIPERK